MDFKRFARDRSPAAAAAARSAAAAIMAAHNRRIRSICAGLPTDPARPAAASRALCSARADFMQAVMDPAEAGVSVAGVDGIQSWAQGLVDSGALPHAAVVIARHGCVVLNSTHGAEATRGGEPPPRPPIHLPMPGF